MKQFNKLIRVSKESILKKHFQINEDAYNKFTDAEKQAVKDLLPNDDELDFMEVYRSTIPQLARLKRKMSICLDVEVLDYDFNFIEFTYSGFVYRLEEPKNAYKICQALDKDFLEGLSELARQGCLQKDGKSIYDLKQSELQVDEIQLLRQVAEKFFFQTFTA